VHVSESARQGLDFDSSTPSEHFLLIVGKEDLFTLWYRYAAFQTDRSSLLVVATSNLQDFSPLLFGQCGLRGGHLLKSFCCFVCIAMIRPFSRVVLSLRLVSPRPLHETHKEVEGA